MKRYKKQVITFSWQSFDKDIFSCTLIMAASTGFLSRCVSRHSKIEHKTSMTIVCVNIKMNVSNQYRAE